MKALGRAAAALVCGVALAACGGPEVTDRELLDAAHSAAACLTARGLEPIGPQPGAGGVGYVLGVYTDPGTSEAVREDAVDALTVCWEEHVGDLEGRYYDGLALTGEAWERDYREMIACLEDAGVTGIRLGDREETVGTAVGENADAINCLQAHLWHLFRGVNDPDL